MLRMCAAVGMALLLSGVAFAADAGVISERAQTTHYRLVLMIGPVEQMYSKAEAAKTHPTSGEITTGGQMQMAMSGMAMDTRHLEIHVYSRATGKVVTTATCTITVVNRTTGMRMAVPIATMYGATEGTADWHYGNNVTMPPAAYDIIATANGERVTFHVTIPKM